MPWRETSPMEQRLEFVREYETGLFTMTELAAQYGISRKTGYKWLDHYEREGALGLRDRSRRPHHSPHATDPDAVEALLARAAPSSALGREEAARGGRPATARGPTGRVDRPSVRCSKRAAWSRRGAAARARPTPPPRRWRRSRR